MAKRPTSQSNHSWAVYHIRGTPAQFVGLVYDAPDGQSAIAKARPADRSAAGLIKRRGPVSARCTLAVLFRNPCGSVEATIPIRTQPRMLAQSFANVVQAAHENIDRCQHSEQGNLRAAQL
jgi:hypothetical protein